MSVSKVCICFWVFTREKLAVFQVSVFKVRFSDSKVSVLSVHFHCLRVNRRPKR